MLTTLPSYEEKHLGSGVQKRVSPTKGLPGSRHRYMCYANSHSLLSPSKCKGFTRISEDSSEIAFLLVENYFMTTRYGLRFVSEFLKKISLRLEESFLFITCSPTWTVVKKRHTDNALIVGSLVGNKYTINAHYIRSLS